MGFQILYSFVDNTMSPLSGVNPDAANQQLLVSDDEDNELPNSAAAGRGLALSCSDGLVLS